MQSEKDAINRLVNEKSKVSSHYFIKNSGEILNLVPDLYTAWHAGISRWKKYKSINNYSIGIEIHNPGHQYKYKSFSRKQIQSLLKLTLYLKKKYKIQSKFILGHSDISPDRKKDPGEKFPWKYLSSKKIGFWHDLDTKKIFKERNINVDESSENTFLKNLFKIGYSLNLKKKKRNLKILTIAFQRRFRQELINGIVDKECLIISNNLVKNLKKFT